MSYTNPEFQGRVQVLVGDARSFGTATASGAAGHTLSDVTELPKFIRRTAVNAARLKVRTIPNANSTGLIARLMNGTNTAGTAVLTTAALGATVDFTMNKSYNTFTAGSEPTINLVGTSTASAAACGAYDIFFEQRELPS